MIAQAGNKGILKRVTNKLRSIRLSFPKNVECNICGWSGREFVSDGWHPGTVCYRCRSKVRNRLVKGAIDTIPGISRKDLIQGKRVLHFAPEKMIAPLFRDGAASYQTTDFMRDDVDLKLDISSMPRVPDGSVDLIVVCDVLEHVPDHLGAMREMYRVLGPGGCAIITVPQKDNLEQSFEDPNVRTDEDRDRVYGQTDHVRVYGNDVPRLLEGAGFQVRVIDASNFSPAMVKRNVLFPPVLSDRPLATNHRKVFFACKG